MKKALLDSPPEDFWHFNDDNLPEVIAEQWKIYAAINDWIRFADTKAGLILTANGVLAGFVLNLLKDQSSLVWQHANILLPLTFGFIFLIVSAAFCLYCIRPRVRIGKPESLIFFDHIARRFPDDPGAYLKAVEEKSQTKIQLLRQISQQVWANAKVAERKHGNVAAAVNCLIVSLICALFAGLTFSVSSNAAK